MSYVPTFTYDNGAIREDLINIITNVSPKETQLLSGLKRSKAEQPIHQWTYDTLDTVGSNAAAEGAAINTTATTNPTRDINYCQILTKAVTVAGSDEEANTAGMVSRMSYELDKKSKAWANDAEYALMRSTLVCGTGTTARQMKGLKAFASTLKTNQSGVSLSEDMFINHLDAGWENGVDFTEAYVGRVLKKRINGWTANSTLNLDANDKRLVNTIDVYESTNGLIKIFRHRYVTVAADTNNDFVTIDPKHISTAYYRQPKVIDLARTGDAENKAIVGELTLEVRAEQAVGLVEKLK